MNTDELLEHLRIEKSFAECFMMRHKNDDNLRSHYNGQAVLATRIIWLLMCGKKRETAKCTTSES